MKRPIAVLIGPQTGSSGETVVISFIGTREQGFLVNQPGDLPQVMVLLISLESYAITEK